MRESDVPKIPTPILKVLRCNPYGGETSGPDAVKFLGGLSRFHPKDSVGGRFWYCKNEAVGKFRMVCPHGHRGQSMPLCFQHWWQFTKSPVEFCPKCHEPGHELHPGVRCTLSLVMMS